jgi:hypothetical protein
VLRHANARRTCEEGDEEVMIARQAVGRSDFAEHLADYAAQCVLCENVVADMILPHTVTTFLNFASRYLCHEPGIPKTRYMRAPDLRQHN